MQLLVSVGQPQVVFTNEKDIKRVDGRNGAPLDPIAEGPQEEEDPTYNAARHARRLHRRRPRDAQGPDQEGRQGRARSRRPARSSATSRGRRPADTNLIAMNSENADGTRDMCLARRRAEGDDSSTASRRRGCCPTARSTGTRTAARSSRTRSRHRSTRRRRRSASRAGALKKDKPAFSAERRRLEHRAGSCPNVEKPGKGVLDAAISPDGKQLAVVSNQGSSFFKLFLTDARRLQARGRAKGTPIRACKVAWRGDSQELIVVQADAGCAEQTGALVAVEPERDEAADRCGRRRATTRCSSRSFSEGEPCCAPAVAASSSGERASAAAVAHR